MLVINPRYLTHIDTTRAPMKNILYTYLATLACLGVLDLAYLGTFGIKTFQAATRPGRIARATGCRGRGAFFISCIAQVWFTSWCCRIAL